MRGKFYSEEDREKARKMVIEGRTYSEIFRLLGIPKSTISTWYGSTLKRPRTKKEMLIHLASIRPRAMEVIKSRARQRRDIEDKNVLDSVNALVKKVTYEAVPIKKTILAMLYWAEGAKHDKVFGITFVNTDPKLLVLFMTLLRQSYSINESKLSVRLNLHYYHSKNESISFWSKTLNIPEKQFTKPHFKKRHNTKRFRKNFAGICSIYYGSNFIRKELMGLAYSLQSLIIKPIEKPLSFNG